MKVFDNSFERKWTVIFFVLYMVILLPVPFFYSQRYHPSVAGLPLFMIGWAVHTALTYGAIALFAKQALQRPEYDLEEGTDHE